MQFLYGKETFLLTQRFLSLKEEFIKVNGVYSYEEFSENDALESFVEAFSSMSLFSPIKMIVYKGFPKIREDYEEYFQKLLLEQQTSHKIVFIYEGDPDKRRKFTKFLLKNCECEFFEPFSIWNKNEFVNWIIEREESRGVKINKPSAELLIELVGTDLWLLESNLLKIETYVLPEKRITEKDVQLLAVQSEKSILDIFESLRKKNKSLYSFVFDSLNTEEAVGMVGILSSHLRLMLLLKTLNNANSLNELALKINKNRFYLKNLYNDINDWTFAEIKMLLSELHQLDHDIKAGLANPIAELEMILTKYIF